MKINLINIIKRKLKENIKKERNKLFNNLQIIRLKLEIDRKISRNIHQMSIINLQIHKKVLKPKKLTKKKKLIIVRKIKSLSLIIILLMMAKKLIILKIKKSKFLRILIVTLILLMMNVTKKK